MLARIMSGWRVGATPDLRDEHDLADVAPLLDEAVGIRGAVEWERFGDDGAKLTLAEALEKRLGEPVQASLPVPPGEHVEPEDALVLVYDPDALPPRHRRHGHSRHAPQGADKIALAAPGLKLRRSVHDEAPALAQQAVVLSERGRAECVHD